MTMVFAAIVVYLGFDIHLPKAYNHNKMEVKESYESPKIKTVEIDVQAILCQSGDGTEQYTRNMDPDIF